MRLKKLIKKLFERASNFSIFSKLLHLKKAISIIMTLDQMPLLIQMIVNLNNNKKLTKNEQF